MLSAHEQLSLWVHLSMIDGELAEEEKNFIEEIGSRCGLDAARIRQIMEKPDAMPELNHLTSDEKFDCLINSIRLMKSDRKVYNKEILFCEKLANSLGYKPRVVAELSPYIYSSDVLNTSTDHLKAIADAYINY